jgi:hypothetical protein
MFGPDGEEERKPKSKKEKIIFDLDQQEEIKDDPTEISALEIANTRQEAAGRGILDLINTMKEGRLSIFKERA